ncbi:hypothetical protein [Paenibacillus sp. GCM10027626]|uniref:hypothetical protein n=1 Tax=Paenibacillus sp. GCM10027626 TaxID=3273411 RepID=UPI0036421241
MLSNSNYPVSKSLQDKIRRIAEEYNYIPNSLGKQLKTNATTTIGVIIPSSILFTLRLFSELKKWPGKTTIP